MRDDRGVRAGLASRVTEPGELASLTRSSKRASAPSRSRSVWLRDRRSFVKPDDYIDIYWTGDIRGRRRQTRQIESAILVIAVDKSINEGQVSFGH
jgi:pilus assembly protein CpaB